MGSNEQGGITYCSRMFCSDLDHLNCDINYLYFTFSLLLYYVINLYKSRPISPISFHRHVGLQNLNY